jgi:hypothetical protein
VLIKLVYKLKTKQTSKTSKSLSPWDIFYHDIPPTTRVRGKDIKERA